MLSSELRQELQKDSVGFIKREYNRAMITEDKKFYEKSGFCSAYAHGCGYMDTLEHEGWSLRLYAEHGSFDVQVSTRFFPRILWWTGKRADAKKLFTDCRKVILGFTSLDLPTGDREFTAAVEQFKNIASNYEEA